MIFAHLWKKQLGMFTDFLETYIDEEILTTKILFLPA
jgi:hypothetical protein